ncbi:MAG: class I SAM-dependent methyltransferase [Candidatus Omnitrophota bacterium]|nr:MAG: class I SAM-dependent methyltransferase [Candidatus Omnitrophota bacterium]
MLNKNNFYKFLFNYKPLPYEEAREQDSRFDLKRRYVNYALRSRDRFYLVLKCVLKYFSSTTLKVLDLGTYPGTMLRVLREFLPEYTFELYGAGLCFTSDFIKIMKDKADATILTVNLDPKNEQLRSKNYSTRIPLEDGSIDFVFALDIIEHLHSPIHILRESNRVLKRGGKILITTNNVTRIGSVLKLLIGKSNYDCLMPIDYYNEDDEWRPHFREYSMDELVNLLAKANCKPVDRVFFNSNETYFNVKSIKQKLVDSIKIPFYCIPHLKEHILIIGEKCSNM